MSDASPRTLGLVRRLLGLAWSHRRRSLVALAVQVALLALGLAGLGLSGLAIDVIRHTLDPAALAPRWPFGLAPPSSWSPLQLVMAAGGLVFLLAVVRALLTYAYGVSIGRLVQAEVVPALRSAVYGKLQRMSFRFYDATASGSIITRVTGDVQNVRAFIDQVLIAAIVLVLAVGVSLSFMLRKDATLTLACLGLSPLLFLATTTFSRWVFPSYDESRRRLDRLITTFTETVQGMSVVKGFDREADRQTLFERHNALLREQQRGIFRRVSLFTPAIDFLSQASLVVLLGYGGMLVVRGRLSLGDLVVFAGLLQQYGAQVANLANIVNSLQQSLISARRVFEVLDARVEVDTPAAPVSPQPFSGAVRFEHVAFAYRPGEPTLDEINLDVRPGQRVVLFGETGSGKSTLLSLIPRFYDVTKGRLAVSGVDVRQLDPAELRRKVGMVFQESFLFSTTVADNIAFGRPEATMEEIERAARLASAHAFIMALPNGYDAVLEEGGSNLSGGQRQRLALARAIVLDPPILLLDDPTAAVDPETEAEVLAALEQVSAARTTFLATHRISACRRADLIVVLEQGRVVERGTHDELVRARGRYAAAVELQVEGGRAAAPAAEVRA